MAFGCIIRDCEAQGAEQLQIILQTTRIYRDLQESARRVIVSRVIL